MEAWVEIIRPDGSAERHRIEGTRATIGSSPTADIPLVNNAELLPVHLGLFPTPEGCGVMVDASAKPALAAGKSVRQDLVPWGTEVLVGNVTLKVHDRLPAPRNARRVSPVTLLSAVVLPAAAWMMFQDATPSLPERPDVPPPELFDEPTECSEQGNAALHKARESAEIASFKAERYPFDVRDGIEAARQYGVAERCYQAAGYERDAARVRRLRVVVQRLIDEDYRMLRLRLDLALESDRPLVALREVRVLRLMVRHREGEYASWLALLERRLPVLIRAQEEEDD